MSTLFERLDSAATELGKKVQAGAETLRLTGEVMRHRHRLKIALEDYGRYAHTVAKGGADDQARRDALIATIDEHDAAIAKLEREISAAKGEVVSVHEKPEGSGE